MLSEQGWTNFSHIVTFLKYSFTAATTALSIVSLRHDTTYKSSEPSAVRELTPVGRYYLAGVIALAAITITTTVVGDVANARLDQIKKQKAQAELDRVLQGQLDKQLQQGIKPVLQALGTNVEKQTEAVLHDLEKQAEQSTGKLRAAQNDLLSRTRQSAQSLAALNTGMEASASLTRELSDRQQRLAEASSQITGLGVVVTVPARNHAAATPGAPASGEDERSVAPDIRKALFNVLPDVQTRIEVYLGLGQLLAADVPCPAAPDSEKLAPVTPCLKGTGGVNARLGPEGVAPPLVLDVHAEIRDFGPPQPASALRIEVARASLLRAKPPLRSRDLESPNLFLTVCVAPGGGLAQAAPAAQEAALRRVDQSLPNVLDVRLEELLLPVEKGSEYPASHEYTYLRVKDRSSKFTKGCLQPFYRVSF